MSGFVTDQDKEKNQIKQTMDNLKIFKDAEALANNEKTPETASAARMLIERLKNPNAQPSQERSQQFQDRSDVLMKLAPLTALASPEVGQRLMQAIQLHQQSKPKEQVFSPEEQRLAKAAELENTIAKLRGQQDEIRQAELDLKQRREERLGRQFDWKATQRDELSDKQLERVTGYDSVIAELDEIENMKQDVNTGYLVNKAQSAQEMFGAGMNPKFAALSTRSGQNLFNYIKNQSGAQYSDKELVKLKQNMPNVEDDDATFNAKMDTVKEITKNARERFLNNISKYQGKEVKQDAQPSNRKDNKLDTFRKLMGR